MRRAPHIIALTLAALLLAVQWVPAQVPIHADSVQFEPFGLTGYPYVFYTPETDFALGGALVATLRASADTTRKPSSATLSGYYSIKDQYDIYLVPEYYTPDNSFYITGFIDWGRFVDKFWGIGDTASDFPEVGYVRTLLAFQVDVQYRVAEALTVGMNYDLNKTVVTEKQMNPYLLAGSVTGSEGGFSSGLGLSLMFDTRDNGFAPYRGTLLKMNGYTYADWLGSGFSFEKLTIDVRHYTTLTPRLVLALQGYFGYANGETPFYQLPLLGGSKVMRGYYLGRYRDNVYLAAQAEARWQIARKFGAVVWLGMGGGGVGSPRIEAVAPAYHGRLRAPLCARRGRTPERADGRRLREGPHGRALERHLLRREGGVLTSGRTSTSPFHVRKGPRDG